MFVDDDVSRVVYNYVSIDIELPADLGVSSLVTPKDRPLILPSPAYTIGSVKTKATWNSVSDEETERKNFSLVLIW